MIGFFPEAYNDELAYSVFARYYSKSGYACYISSAEDLYVNPKVKPNIEFCNLLTNDALKHIGSIERFINNHTMLSYYLFTLSPEKQTAAVKLAYSMNIKSLVNALPIPKSKIARYLKYCPICVNEDREKYGETYWHRAHQIYGVTACHKHDCKLIDSNVQITTNATPSFINAESSIGYRENVITQALPVEIDIAKYTFEIIKNNISSQTSVDDYLNIRLLTSPYRSTRGAKRYIQDLSDDLKSYYKDIELLGFGEPWQLEKIFTGYRLNPFEISLLSMFLGIEANELVSRENRYINDFSKGFDNKIKELKLSGYNYREIAAIMNISYDYCKFIGNRKEYKKRITTNHNGGKKVDWKILDNETLPRVINLVAELNNVEVHRPQRVSVGKVERLLGLKEYQLKRLPQCLDYVMSNTITQEEFWAKTIAWAINRLEKEDKPTHITNIMKLTNINKVNIIRALPYLKNYINTSDIGFCNSALDFSV